MLKIFNLRKSFDSVIAVDGVSFDVKRGELFGLLGPNGAGKTTTIRTVLNIILPDSGSITFDGKPFTQEMWNNIGYLPEERGLYKKSKIINTILYFASLKGLSEKDAKPIAYQWLDRFGLKDGANRKVEELSKGNQQKVQLIASVLHSPQLLILDEPFTGLDPVNQIILKDILMELRQQNVAIIFSTHQMEQVEKMCDNICLINKGKPVLNGALADIKKQYGTNSVRLEFEGDGSFLKTLPNVKRADVYQNYAELELTDISKSRELLAGLDDRLDLRKYEIVEPSLNSIFINIVGPPPPLEDIMEVSASVKKKSSTPQDPRVRKALLSFGLSIVFAIVFIAATSAKGDVDPMMIGLWIAIIAFSGFRYFKTKNDVLKSLGSGKEGGQ
ncbi:MAG: ATP-binding cassette domain-containing protein [bacterium]